MDQSRYGTLSVTVANVRQRRVGNTRAQSLSTLLIFGPRFFYAHSPVNRFRTKKLSTAIVGTRAESCQRNQHALFPMKKKLGSPANVARIIVVCSRAGPHFVRLHNDDNCDGGVGFLGRSPTSSYRAARGPSQASLYTERSTNVTLA